MDYSKIVRFYVFACVGIVFLIVGLELLVYVVYASILKVILHLYGTIYFTLSTGISTITILAVTMRLKRINLVCRTLIGRDKNRFSHIKVHAKKQQNELEIIGKLYEIYSNCIDVCDLINLCFMFQVMLSYGLVFFFTIFSSFSVYKDYSSYGILLPETVVALAFCIYYNLFLIIIISMCYQAEEEVSEILHIFLFPSLN